MNELKKQNILILDDDKQICNLLQSFLKKMKGIDCVVASDPIEAMYKIENQQFSYLIVDYHLKQKTGIDFIRNLKRIEKYKDMNYILISGNVEKKMVIEALQLGVSDILVKPFESKDLFGKLKIAI